MPLRRLASLLAILVLLGLGVWAATHVRVVSGGSNGAVQEQAASAEAFGTGFEGSIGDAPRPRGAIDYERIDQRLSLLMQRPSMVGLAVGIVEDGEIRFLKGYGETVAGTADPVTVDTVFRWASLSKGVAGDMVALLAQDGKLSLYQPVNRYASSLRLPGGAEARATISDLLSHQLGLFAHAQDSKLEDGMDPRYLRGTLATLNSICSPGQCHAYQNVAFDAASEIVERVTGQSYADAVRQRLFLPLGMRSATMSRAGLLSAASWAQPHTGGINSRPVEVTESYYRVPAAGGVNSSIKDLAIWMRAQMGLERDVLAPELLAAVQSPRANTPRENSRRRKYRERIGGAAYGLGWRIYDYAGHRVIGHRGGVRGYRSLILFDPQRRTGVVALWNSSAAQPGGLEFEVMDMLYGLEFRDWLELDQRSPEPAPEPVETLENALGENVVVPENALGAVP